MNTGYDGCGVCADIGDGTSEPFYSASITTDNCVGTDGSGAAKWNEDQCVNCGVGGAADCQTYNIPEHPHHNAMDCAGICLNEFNDGTYGQAVIDSTYADVDGDSWGDPSTGIAHCSVDALPPGRVFNKGDVKDVTGYACNNDISSEIDCNQKCKYKDDGSLNTDYKGDILTGVGCDPTHPNLPGCDACGVCGGDGKDYTCCDGTPECVAGDCSLTADTCGDCGGDNPASCLPDGETCSVASDCEADYLHHNLHMYLPSKNNHLLHILEYHHSMYSLCHHRHKLHMHHNQEDLDGLDRNLHLLIYHPYNLYLGCHHLYIYTSDYNLSHYLYHYYKHSQLHLLHRLY
jgi:hypothetical protein